MISGANQDDRRMLRWAGRGWPVIMLALLVAAYLAPRLTELDRIMTVDESFWLGFSANFYEGIANGNLEHTYQYAYPGVPVMWAGAIGFMISYPDYPQEHPGQIGKHYAVHEDLADLGRSATNLLMTARIVKILMQGVLFAVGAWLSRNVLGPLVGTVGSLLIALDPFLLGHDRLLHADGMTAVAAWVSIMSLLRYSQVKRHLWLLVLSGATAAVAWLTRSPALVLAPVAALALLVDGLPGWRQQPAATIRRLLVRGSLWLGSAVATTVALWPALWVAPGMVAERMYAYTRDAAEQGHEAGTFFAGEIYRGAESSWFYYPASLAFRLTPVTTIGLTLVVLAVILRWKTVLPEELRRPVALLALFAVLYLAGMSVGAKKFDRYILPIFPAIDLIAAVGIVGAGEWLRDSVRPWRRVLTHLMMLGALFGQLASAFSMAPYYLPYFNPVMGGVAAAEDTLLLGWGEGMDQAAAYILSQPGGANAVVHTSNARVSLIYVLPPSVHVETHAYETDMASLAQWGEADYYVAYVSQWQRGYFSRPIDYLAQFEPVHTVSFGGVDFVRTYDLRAIPPPPEMIQGLECTFAFGEDVRLLAYHDQKTPVPEENLHNLTLSFMLAEGAASTYDVRVELIPREADIPTISRTVELHRASQPGVLSQAEADVVLSGIRTVKSYEILVTVLDPETGKALPVQSSITGDIAGRASFIDCE